MVQIKYIKLHFEIKMTELSYKFDSSTGSS